MAAILRFYTITKLTIISVASARILNVYYVAHMRIIWI
jgi:hypothetical protein